MVIAGFIEKVFLPQIESWWRGDRVGSQPAFGLFIRCGLGFDQTLHACLGANRGRDQVAADADRERYGKPGLRKEELAEITAMFQQPIEVETHTLGTLGVLHNLAR
jgi:hypothetical protein